MKKKKRKKYYKNELDELDDDYDSPMLFDNDPDSPWLSMTPKKKKKRRWCKDGKNIPIWKWICYLW